MSRGTGAASEQTRKPIGKSIVFFVMCQCMRMLASLPHTLLHTILRLHLASKRVNVGGGYFEIILAGNKRHALTRPCARAHTRTDLKWFVMVHWSFLFWCPWSKRLLNVIGHLASLLLSDTNNSAQGLLDRHNGFSLQHRQRFCEVVTNILYV